MKRRRDIFGVSAAAESALAIGRTPDCWRNDLARAAAGTGSLRRTCDWIEPLTKLSPKLRDESLFGRCLAEIFEATVSTSADRSSPQRRPSASRPKPAQPRPPSKPAAPGRRGQPVAGDSVECRPRALREHDEQHEQSLTTALPAMPPPRKLPPRASHDLLAICAGAQQKNDLPSRATTDGSADRSTVRSSSASAEAQPKTKGIQNSSRQFKPPRRHGNGHEWFQLPAAPANQLGNQHIGQHIRQHIGQLAGQPDNDSRAEHGSQSRASAHFAAETIAQRLARRAAHRLRQFQQLQPANGKNGDHSPGQFQPVNGGNEWMSEQLDATLDGTMASHDLLRQIVTGERVIPYPARNGKSSQPSPPVPGHQPQFRPLPEMGAATDSNRSRTNLLQGQTAAFDRSFASERQYNEEARFDSHDEPIAPPSLARSLPAATPLQNQNIGQHTGVLPLAADLARHGARAEAMPAEDLDALAAKIKFILDEEARRHGIDV